MAATVKSNQKFGIRLLLKYNKIFTAKYTTSKNC